MSEQNNKIFYRLRSLKSIFEYKELENQEIYFASLDELNDPMEGFRNIVFKGDKIVWQNLFRHYFKCLEWICRAYALGGEKFECKISDFIPLYAEARDFPTPMYRESFDKIYQEFIQVCGKTIKAISRRTTAVSRKELLFYLSTIHYIALGIIQRYYIEQGFIEYRGFDYPKNTQPLAMVITMVDNIEKLINENKEQNKDILRDLFDVYKNIMHSVYLGKLQDTEVSSNRNFILFEFMDFYVQNLEKLMYPECYIACFMEEAHNSSIWGHYGDGHKGICLIFKSENNSLELYGKRHNEDKGEWYKYNFEKINYEDSYNEINFFETIGRLPIPALISTWYADESDNKSPILDTLFKNKDERLNQYWNNVYKEILIKTKDWDYEKEYRIVMDSFLDDEIDKENRKFKYHFKDLCGIIFGMRTSMKDKIKIKKIIDEKCKIENREDFEFYQAYYCQKNKNIQYELLWDI